MKLSISLALALSLSSCALFEPRIEERIVYLDKKISVVDRPEPVQLQKVYFYAVSEKTLEEFLSKFEAENGAKTFIAVSIPDYEALSLNIAELKRYIEQQNQVIIYYESLAAEE